MTDQREHPAVKAAVALLVDWLNGAGRGDRVPAKNAMRRLWQESVDPFDMLKAASSSGSTADASREHCPMTTVSRMRSRWLCCA